MRTVLVVALASVLVALVGASSQRAAAGRPAVSARVGLSGIAGPARIEVRFRTSTGGTFAITGAVSDRGSFTARRRLVGGSVRLTEVLAGKEGTLRIRVQATCASGRGTWKVLSGTEAYRGMTGGGNARGGPKCAKPSYPVIAVYSGTVRTPVPPPIAQAGRYAGSTGQREEVVFDVAAGGRTVANLKLNRLTVKCSPTFTLVQTISMVGPIAIDDGGSFSSEAVLPSGLTQRVSGRFTSSTVAAGTAAVAHTFTDPSTGTKIACAGSVAWTASLPPPSALPGRYCGFTLQGPGICLDVSGSGREVTHFESAVVVRCFPGGAPPTEIEVSLTYDGSIPIGGHLGFQSGRLAVEGLISGTGSIGGLFEPNGTASGGVSLGVATLDYEGTRYNCHPATGKWEARR